MSAPPPPPAHARTAYTAEDFVVLEWPEHIRRRPAMYIGSTGPEGLFQLVMQPVGFAIEHAKAGYCSNLEVVIGADGSVSVEDDGPGLPTELDKVRNVTALR